MELDTTSARDDACVFALGSDGQNATAAPRMALPTVGNQCAAFSIREGEAASVETLGGAAGVQSKIAAADIDG